MITFHAIIHEIWLVYGLHIQQEKSLVVLLGFVIYKKIRQEKWFYENCRKKRTACH